MRKSSFESKSESKSELINYYTIFTNINRPTANTLATVHVIRIVCDLMRCDATDANFQCNVREIHPDRQIMSSMGTFIWKSSCCLLLLPSSPSPSPWPPLFTYNSLDNTFVSKAHLCVFVLINAHNSRIDAHCTHTRTLFFSSYNEIMQIMNAFVWSISLCVSDQRRKKERIFKNTERLNQWMTLCQCVYWLISAYSAITVDE